MATRSRSKAVAAMAPAPRTAAPVSIEAFSFGDAESVLDRREILNAVESWRNGRWYEPPINPRSLARVLEATSHHRSAIGVKLNLLVKTFQPSRWLDRATFRKWMLDYLVMGNGYVNRIDNMLGKPLSLQHSLAMNTRRGIVDGEFFFINPFNLADVHEYVPGSMFQLMESDVSQEIYGRPEYLSALQGMMLNEAATLFRRRYYINGGHAGYVFYLSEPTMSDKDVNAIRESLRNAKGVGNFKNLFIHAANGKKDGVQIIPISEVAAKDEFLGIKNTSRDDVLAAHRVPPQLLGVVPSNAGGFGDVARAAEVFFVNEIGPLQTRTLELNDWLGLPAISYAPYDLSSIVAAGPPPAS